MIEEQKDFHCPNCGAPVTSEVCPYCNVFTGINTKDANMEYPVMECKEAHINFWNTIFPLIFAISFGIPGLIIPLAMYYETKKIDLSEIIFFIPFSLIGLGALIIFIKTISRYLSIKRNGQIIYGTVYGYMNDNLLINEMPAQIVKILVDTDEGKRFILYQLQDTKQPYKINGRLKLYVYNNIFLIPKNPEEL